MPATASLPDKGRRALLRGGCRRPTPAIRPPWTTEASIVGQCSRCDACRTACPQGIIAQGDGGFPVVDFLCGAGECTFCGACAQACPEQLFDPDMTPAWDLKLAINPGACLPQAGVHCEACRDICDQRAIAFAPRLGGPARPEINADKCNGCGACLSVCPVQAISAAPALETFS